MRFTKFSFLSAYFLLLLISCSKDAPKTENQQVQTEIDLVARASAQRLYEDYYMASTFTSSDVAWTGNEPSCDAGSVPQNTKDKILMRLAYFRIATGLNNTIAEETSKSVKAQAAALMMHANGELNHSPPNSWKCFSNEGKEAAGQSLLTSANNAFAIDTYIRDDGAENGPVGHRRWLLWPKLQEIGIGNTSQYNALWVLGNGGAPPADSPDFVAWPPEGYLPKQVTYPRWSFSITDADFTGTTIAMNDNNGSTIGIEMEELTGVYGDNTIVWKPLIDVNEHQDDVAYLMTIKNVLIDGVTRDFEYEVVLFDANN